MKITRVYKLKNKITKHITLTLMVNLFSANRGVPFQVKFQVNLLNDDTFRLNCVTSSYEQIRVRCALNMEIFDLLNEESVSGARSGRASL